MPPHLVDHMPRAIKTSYWAKPHHSRSCDWECCFEDWDLGDHISFGATEAEAVADFEEWCREREAEQEDAAEDRAHRTDCPYSEAEIERSQTVISRLLLTEVPSLPDGSAPAEPVSDRRGPAGAIIPGARVRLYSKPYCRDYWDGTVLDDAGDQGWSLLTGLVLVEWDDGTITRIGKSDLEVVR